MLFLVFYRDVLLKIIIKREEINGITKEIISIPLLLFKEGVVALKSNKSLYFEG